MEKPADYLPLPERIRALKGSRRYSEAEEEIRRELEKHPDHLYLRASLADLYLRQDRVGEARIITEEILSRDPQHAQGLSVLGDVYLREGRPREALECYRQAYSRAPQDYLVLKAAKALKEMKRFGEALDELDRVLVVKPASVPFLRERALLLNQTRKFDLALQAYEKINGISPGDSFVEKEIVRLKSRTHPGEQVVRELKMVVGMDSRKGDAQMHGLLGQKLKEEGQIREAAAEYKTAAELAPHNVYFLKQEGFCHYQVGNYEGAIRCLAEAFRRDPADSVVRKNLQKMYEARNENEKFLRLLEEIYREHPHRKNLLGPIRKLRKALNLEPRGES
ncbi:MAG TPA: tetratricopeptide repeat protein [Thermodesulfobacteriota bacterium]|nr:tetratricopeptide repeat protein [Thermodesulfobacteriota bacterium]